MLGDETADLSSEGLDLARSEMEKQAAGERRLTLTLDGSAPLGDETADLVTNNCHQSGLVTEGAPPGKGAVTKRKTSGIRLRCAKCGLTLAVLDDGYLVVRSRHHGEVHENRWGLWELIHLVLRGK